MTKQIKNFIPQPKINSDFKRFRENRGCVPLLACLRDKVTLIPIFSYCHFIEYCLYLRPSKIWVHFIKNGRQTSRIIGQITEPAGKRKKKTEPNDRQVPIIHIACLTKTDQCTCKGKRKTRTCLVWFPFRKKNSAVSKIDKEIYKNFNLEVCGQQKTRYYRATSTWNVRFQYILKEHYSPLSENEKRMRTKLIRMFFKKQHG